MNWNDQKEQSSNSKKLKFFSKTIAMNKEVIYNKKIKVVFSWEEKTLA